jgi:ubiquitin-conjugating enzyme E2 I
MGSIAKSRLAEERKKWRKDHPFGFVAKPAVNTDGTVDLMTWSCLIPGKEGSIWEGGLYPVTLKFPKAYPSNPPTVYFPKSFPHPNVFENGEVCLSLLNPEKSWKASISVKEILLGLQELLVDPNNTDPANWEFADLYRHKKKEYEK